MSMIEKFLEEKEVLRKNIEDVREAAVKATNAKTDEMVDNFVGSFKDMIAKATNYEFVEFITSGKLDDEDIFAAIAFRAETGVKSQEEVCEDVMEACKRPIRMVVIGEI